MDRAVIELAIQFTFLGFVIGIVAGIITMIVFKVIQLAFGTIENS
jgi:hypothetical protein